MRVDELAPAPGSKKAARRVGRGIGGKGGKTAGRGTKGQYARNTVARGFEGGQMPLKQRVPKLKGFNNPFRVEYQAVNLDTIEALGVAEVTPEVLRERGIAHKDVFVKVLARGKDPASVKAGAVAEAEAQRARTVPHSRYRLMASEVRSSRTGTCGCAISPPDRSEP